MPARRKSSETRDSIATSGFWVEVWCGGLREGRLAQRNKGGALAAGRVSRGRAGEFCGGQSQEFGA
jgi:hypothetical protein